MGEPVDHGAGRGEDGRTARAARVLAVLRDLWGDEPPPGQDPELAWLVDALAVDDAHGRENGYVVRGDAITVTSLAHWLTSPQFPDEQTGAWQWDSATGRVQLDELASRVLGVGRGPVGFERLALDVHPGDRAQVEQAVRRAATTGEPFRVTFRGRSPQGEWLWRTSAGRRVSATGAGVVLVGFVTVHQQVLPVE
ncbi:PAS domain-containing protein [Kineococcus sp. SYSU DK001]|uniref:PAS domain-containing protein n=1 Tax=Kineococcus sp. SYSU DK001 TaxID=3383122 RepID=UPI003D7EF396